MRLLDLYCCAGGAAVGYHRAGFHVTGVDIKPQPRYPFAFVQADALEYVKAHGHEYDAIHASPPCKPFTDLKDMYNALEHPDLLTPTREALDALGVAYIIENVESAPMAGASVKLCGTMFGLGVGDAELWRHRLFDINWPFPLVPPCRHRERPRVIGVYGGHGRDRRRVVNTQDYSTEQRRIAMGIDWMTSEELSQAIPPAYTEFIGRHLVAATNHTGVSQR